MMGKNLGSKTSSYGWTGQTALLTTATDPSSPCVTLHLPLLPRPPHLCPGSEMVSAMERGEGLREGWRRTPPQHNDNHRDLAIVPPSPWTLSPAAPRSAQHIIPRLSSWTLWLHIYISTTFFLLPLFFLICYCSSFFFTYYTSFFFCLFQNSSLSPLCLLHFICTVQVLCVCMCNNYHLEY